MLLFILAVASVDNAAVISTYLLSQAFQPHVIGKIIFILFQGEEMPECRLHSSTRFLLYFSLNIQDLREFATNFVATKRNMKKQL